ncbi:hypothetical protein UFOVP349_9 [uncultured Caudovirales phage]|uniref:Uncharacterized protein n=1 Tax=uncultured Caudovirales phage TaxID=2100421 RepID=A0A6J5LY72_9CAUD|nr:hypothetical protein UFOVP349_9 [uncultured Caudovirales phage]
MGFAEIGGAVARHARRAVIKCALDLEAHAKTEIQTGAKSGKTYKRTTDAGNTIEHRASAPGEAPATDFGVLVGSISTVPSADPTEAEARVIVTAEYGAALELGREDGSIAARPYIRPAADRIEKTFARVIGQAVAAGAREGAAQ